MQTLFSNRKTDVKDKDELVECLTTGRFDQKNRLVRQYSSFNDLIEYLFKFLRTISNPELHKIDELPEEPTIQSSKLNRSLTDLIQSVHEPTISIKKKKSTVASIPNTNEIKTDSDENEDDEMETLTMALQSCLVDDEHEKNVDEHHLQHASSEPVIKTNSSKSLITTNDIYDDDDDVWCNPEDEDNLEHRVKLDEEKEKQLREVLGEDTLAIIREALKVKKFVYCYLFYITVFLLRRIRMSIQTMSPVFYRMINVI